MNTVQPFRAFKVVYFGATDTKPARIKITDLRFNKSVIVGYSAASASTGHDRAIEYLNDLNIPVTGQAWHELNGQHQYTVLLSTNFNNELK